MNLNHLIIPITIAVILILILVLIVCGYVKAPPDQAYIISGLKHDAKILIGRSGIRIPFFERMDRLVSRADDRRYQDGTVCSDK